MRRWMVAALLGMLGLSACSDDPSGLDVLRLDPLATATLTIAEPDRVTEADWVRGDLGRPASITTTWTVDLDEVDRAVDELAAQARTAGWSLEPKSSGPGWRGDRRIDRGADTVPQVAQLSIDASPTEGIVSVEIRARPGN